MNPRLTAVRRAFDRHSTSYDERFSGTPIAERVRREVWQLADQVFASSSRLLDLGCGTGEDAIHFARQGRHVTAVDVSEGMIAQLRRKAEASGVAAGVDCVLSEMTRYSPAPASFDGLISNFAAINCATDLAWLGEMGRRGLKPGSRLVLTALGAWYPLETLVFLAKAQIGRAFRRCRKTNIVTIEGIGVTVHRHSLSDIARSLGPQFQLEEVRGLCAFRPMPGWEHLDRFQVIRGLAPLDRLWCRSRVTATLADHFVSVWRFQP